MALAVTTHDTSFNLGQRLSRIGSVILTFVVSIGEANSKMRQINYLNSLSDEALAERGLKREDIVRQVFGASMHL